MNVSIDWLESDHQRACKRAGRASDRSVGSYLRTDQPPKPVEIIDLTADDLRDYERKLDMEQGKMAISLGGKELPKMAPKAKSKTSGGWILFENPHHAWAKAKTWEFTYIQALVNLLTTTYDIEPLQCSLTDKLRRADNCAVKLGFLEKTCNASKAHMDAQTKT